MGILDIFKSKAKTIITPMLPKIFDRLYDYQKDAVQATMTNPKGIVCMPTGVGKTFCQAAIIADDILKNPKQFRMYTVNAPRIMLSYQLLKEVYGFLMKESIEARYMFVHSGGKTDEKDLELVRKSNKDSKGNEIPFSEIGSGTSVIGIRAMISKAKQQKLPLIFFSTYNSAERIEEARVGCTKQEITIVLNDEAHYLVQEQFHNILEKFSKLNRLLRCYFFTATMIKTPSDKGRGMNNVEDYGNVLYQMTPRHAIDIGKMVRPRVHYVVTNGIYTPDDYDKSLNIIIADTFKQHEEVLKKTNQLPKILISTQGTQDIIGFLKSKEYQELRAEGIDIYAVASADEVKNRVNDESVRRQEFLKRLKRDGEDPTKRLIVLHYDILAEGIDVSGFTGIMPLRTLNKSKFMQTFGRSARPDKEDRKRVDAKEITPNDLDKLNKPYSYVIIPTIIRSNEDDKANLELLIKELRDEYGYDPSEYIVSAEQTHGIPEREMNDSIPIQIKHVGETIDKLDYELEAEEDAKLSKEELAIKTLKKL
jgi:superfamily II DNA or RNA helicase